MILAALSLLVAVHARALPEPAPHVDVVAPAGVAVLIHTCAG